MNKIKLESDIVDYVRMEGGWWDDDDNELYSLVRERVIYTDLEKGYQNIEVRLKDMKTGKMYDFETHYGSYHSTKDIHGEFIEGVEYIPKPKAPKKVKERTYTEEDVRRAVEFGLNSYEDFDRTSNYDAESREEGIKEIQDDFINLLNSKV